MNKYYIQFKLLMDMLEYIKMNFIQNNKNYLVQQ